MKRCSQFWLAMPGTLALLTLMIVPALSILPMALTDWEFGKGDARFAGVANFIELSTDERFIAALCNSILYVLAVVPLTVFAGLLLAALIERAGPLKSFYRAAHFLPAVATLAAMAVAWEALLHPTFGLLNRALAVIGMEPQNWLRDERLVLPTLIVIGVWQNIGFAVVMFLAGLRTVPQDLLDAARVDGAVLPYDRARTVIWPLLGPITLFVTVMSAKKSLAVFDTVAVLTQGGPADSSEVLLHLMFSESFERLRAGYGAAITVVYLLLMLSVSWAQRLLDKRVHYR